MPTLIVANGDLSDSPELAKIFTTATRIIAVDGGAHHCRRLGYHPDVLIGDLDSVEPEVLQEFQEKSVAIHRHPPRKDATDLALALDLAMTYGDRDIWLLGGLGGRWDMSFANVLLLAGERYKAINFIIFGPDCRMHILRPGQAFTLHGLPGETISFLPLQGDVYGLTLQGFEYPLHNASVHFGSTQGISNVLQEPAATVQFTSGILLCVRLTP